MIARSKDPNCKKFDSVNANYCTECYGGYLAISGRCKEVNPLCKTSNLSNG